MNEPIVKPRSVPPPPPAPGSGRGLVTLVAGVCVVVLAASAVMGVPDKEPPPEPGVAGEVLRITSEPSGTEVWAGKSALGETPLEVQLPSGVSTYAVVLRRPGYRTRTVVLAPGKPTHVVLAKP